MHPDEHLEALRRESAAFAAAARKGADDGRVPSCPEWTVADLVDHLGHVHRFFTNIVRTRSTTWVKPPDAGDASVDWFESGAAQLAAALEEAGPDSPAWNWSGENQRAAWQYRRMAQETAVHRWDAELAHGTPNSIEVELAIDGVDEMLDVFVPAGLREKGDGAADISVGGSVHLHATDSPHGEWIVRIEKGELLVGHGHEKGDVAVRGTASDLLLYLWGRVDTDRFEVFGDESILTQVKQHLVVS